MYVIVFDNQLGKIVVSKEFKSYVDCHQFGFSYVKRYSTSVINRRYDYKVAKTKSEFEMLQKKILSYPHIGSNFNFAHYYKYFYSKDSYQQIIADTFDAMIESRPIKNYSCFFNESKNSLVLHHEYKAFEDASLDGYKEKIVIDMPKTQKSFDRAKNNKNFAYINTHSGKVDRVFFPKLRESYNLTNFIEMLCSVETFFDCEKAQFKQCNG